MRQRTRELSRPPDIHNNLAHVYRGRGKLPLDVHRVSYEDLVTDLEGQSRGLMAFLGKAWRPEVMDYRKRALARGQDRHQQFPPGDRAFVYAPWGVGSGMRAISSRTWTSCGRI